MRIAYHFWGILVILLFSLSPVKTISASEVYKGVPDTTYLLKLTHIRTNTTVFVEKGEYIKIGVGPYLYDGKVDSVSQTFLLLNGIQFPLGMIDYIKVNKSREKLLKTMQAFALIQAVCIPFILLPIIQRYLFTFYFSYSLGQILNIVIRVLYILEIFLLPVSLIIFFKGKLYKHNLRSRWKIETLVK